MTRPRWLDRAVLTAPYYYVLCLCEGDFHRELKRLKVPQATWPPFVRPGYGGQVAFFDVRGKSVAIVNISIQKRCTREEVYGLLIHEAVHLWQALRENMQEHSPASEQEAYIIQHLAQQLMCSYRDQTKRIRGKP